MAFKCLAVDCMVCAPDNFSGPILIQAAKKLIQIQFNFTPFMVHLLSKSLKYTFLHLFLRVCM